MSKKYSMIETFAGAGGSHIGLSQAGFYTVWASDFDKNAIQTLKNNSPDIADYIDCIDIQSKEFRDVIDYLKDWNKSLDLLFGGVPCKSFSMAGQRRKNDPRNYLYLDQLEIVEKLQPKVSVIENVVGIRSAEVVRKDAPQHIIDEIEKCANNKVAKDLLTKKLRDEGYLVHVVEDIFSRYAKLGYKTYIKILDASDYGVASKRRRVIIVAVRNDVDMIVKYKYPEPLNQPKNTVWNTIASIVETKDDPDTLPMEHSERLQKIFSYIPQGMRQEHVLHLIPAELNVGKMYAGGERRLDPNKPCNTLVAGHSDFPIHPFLNRRLTPREAGNIMSFPNDYKFYGTYGQRCAQIGNAVPPLLAYHIGLSVIELLDRYYYLIDDMHNKQLEELE